MNRNNGLSGSQPGFQERLLIHVPDSWQRLIAVIKHQAKAGQFIFIEGSHGAGKSTFGEVLRKKLVLNEELETSYQKLHPLSNVDQILGTIPQKAENLSVVIFDDANEVDAQVLEELIAINIEYFWVILAEPELVNRVPKLQNSRFTLPLFNKQDCHKLLNKQMQAVDLSINVPIMESEIVYYESKGFPGKVLRLGEKLQAKLTRQSSSVKSFDIANKGLLSSIVVGFGILIFLGYLFFSGDSKPVQDRQIIAEKQLQLDSLPVQTEQDDEAKSIAKEQSLELELEIPKPPPPTFAEWVASQNPDHFTIQLYSNKSRESAQKFKDDLDLADSYLYQVKVNNKLVYRVVWGNYPNRARAQLAIQSLPQNIIEQKPWLRSFSAIATELAQNPQKTSF